MEKAKISQTKFHPVIWAFNRHAQTVTCYLISFLESLWSDKVEFQRECIPAYDGINDIFIDWAHTAERNIVAPANADDQTNKMHAEEQEKPKIGLDSNSEAPQWETPILILIHGMCMCVCVFSIKRRSMGDLV